MTIDEARALLEPAFKKAVHNAHWADLGCGAGIFTQALATLLGGGSKIDAVDKQPQPIVRDETGSVDIRFSQFDFAREPLPFTNLDGILMANALHYVKDKTSLVDRLMNHLKPYGQIILVEYDTDIQNQWVPYPITFESLKKTFSSRFTEVKKIGERDSIYRSGKMYACLMKRN